MVQDNQNRVYSGIFLWMSVGVMTTSIFAFATSGNKNLIENISGNNLILLCDILCLMAIAYIFAGSILSLGRTIAKIFFFVYSGFFGMAVSLLFEVLYGASIGYVFFFSGVGYAILSQLYRFADSQLVEAYYWITYIVFTIPAVAIVNFVWHNEVFYWVVSMLIQALMATVLIVDLYFFRRVIPVIRFGKVQKSVLLALLLHVDTINLFFLMVGLTSRPDFDEE